MKVSKNLYRGGEITDLKELVQLAKERKSVFLYVGSTGFVRPAAFIIQWPLAKILNHKIYYTFRESDITEVEFEDK